MPVGPDFLAHVEDLFAGLGRIHTRRMFGGAGVYLGEAIFALAVDDTLYLKTDAQTRERFEAAGSSPFVYAKRGGEAVSTSYWSLPEEALDDREAAIAWARLALEATARKRA